MSAKQDDGIEKWGAILAGIGMKNTETLAEWRERTITQESTTSTSGSLPLPNNQESDQ